MTRCGDSAFLKDRFPAKALRAEFGHGQAVAFGQKLDLTHDMPDQQDAATGRDENVVRVSGVGDRVRVETATFVANVDHDFVFPDVTLEINVFLRVGPAAVHDGVGHRLFEGELHVEHVSFRPIEQFHLVQNTVDHRIADPRSGGNRHVA